jgi:RNA polymerase sigma-70 factor (ECF subfamily)
LRRRFGADQAEDLAQEAYARAAAFRGEVRNPRGFLARVAVNAARDLARRRAVRPATVELWHQAPGVAAPASQDTAVQLKQVILALPPRLREVFLLSRFGGLTYPQIAEHCGISVKTVEARMTKALALCVALME